MKIHLLLIAVAWCNARSLLQHTDSQEVNQDPTFVNLADERKESSDVEYSDTPELEDAEVEVEESIETYPEDYRNVANEVDVAVDTTGKVTVVSDSHHLLTPSERSAPDAGLPGEIDPPKPRLLVARACPVLTFCIPDVDCPVADVAYNVKLDKKKDREYVCGDTESTESYVCCNSTGPLGYYWFPSEVQWYFPIPDNTDVRVIPWEGFQPDFYPAEPPVPLLAPNTRSIPGKYNLPFPEAFQPFQDFVYPPFDAYFDPYLFQTPFALSPFRDPFAPVFDQPPVFVFHPETPGLAVNQPVGQNLPRGPLKQSELSKTEKLSRTESRLNATVKSDKLNLSNEIPDEERTKTGHRLKRSAPNVPPSSAGEAKGDEYKFEFVTIKPNKAATYIRSPDKEDEEDYDDEEEYENRTEYFGTGRSAFADSSSYQQSDAVNKFGSKYLQGSLDKLGRNLPYTGQEPPIYSRFQQGQPGFNTYQEYTHHPGYDIGAGHGTFPAASQGAYLGSREPYIHPPVQQFSSLHPLQSSPGSSGHGQYHPDFLPGQKPHPTRDQDNSEEFGAYILSMHSHGIRKTVDGVNPPYCGRKGDATMPRIVTSPYPEGESVTGFGEYPWHVGLIRKRDYHYICGGVLISLEWVLTVAHCVAGEGPILVRVGDWDLASDNEILPAYDIDADIVIIHHDYHRANLQNDIAMLRLHYPVKLEDIPQVGVACLPQSSALHLADNCRVPGWGQAVATTSGYGNPRQYSWKQQAVGQQIVGRKLCQKELRKTHLGPFWKMARRGAVCAVGDYGRDSCFGDGGSGLVCQLPTDGYSHPRYFVFGLVSWGIGCGVYNRPAMYTKVSDYLDWIHYIIRHDTDHRNRYVQTYMDTGINRKYISLD